MGLRPRSNGDAMIVTGRGQKGFPYSTNGLMATKLRAKSSAGAGKGKAGRRSQVRSRTGSGLPLMPIVVAAILVVLAIGMIVAIVYYSRPTPVQPAVSGVQCDRLEQTTLHYHAALQIVYQGTVHNLKDNIGIQTDPTGTAVSCYYWLHVHAGEPNTIHIESPAGKVFTLGQFMDVWNAWSKANGGDEQKLDATHISTITLTPDETMKVYIDLGDGKGATLFTGDPRTIQLRSHEVITIEVTPPEVTPPPKFTFPSGL